MNFELSTGFDHLSLPAFFDRIMLIDQKLKIEPALTLFPDPWPTTIPSRTEIATAVAEYKTAHEAVDGGKSAIDTRKAKRVILTGLLQRTAPHLIGVAKKANDDTMLDTIGFLRGKDPAATPNTPTELSSPDLKLHHGKMLGQILGKAHSLAGAHSYESQICTGDPEVEANWRQVTITAGATHLEFNGLTPGTMYHFRLRGLDRHGNPGPWSDVAHLRAV